MTTTVKHNRNGNVSVTTDTSGEAFLRNGWSRVTALCFWDSDEGKVYIEVANSRGNNTNGMMIVKQADLMEAMARYILAKRNLEVGVARLNELSQMVEASGANLMYIDEERVDIYEEIALTLINLAGNTEEI